MGKRRRKTFVPKTKQELEALKQALAYTDKATMQGKLVFKDTISGGLFVYRRGNILAAIPEETQLQPWEVPFDVPDG